MTWPLVRVTLRQFVLTELIIRVEGDLEHARNEKYNLIRAIKYSVTGNVSFLTQPD